ncbi:hypothetical protein THAOC_24902, partial [Thalassiosira oceanica]
EVTQIVSPNSEPLKDESSSKLQCISAAISPEQALQEIHRNIDNPPSLVPDRATVIPPAAISDEIQAGSDAVVVPSAPTSSAAAAGSPMEADAPTSSRASSTHRDLPANSKPNAAADTSAGAGATPPKIAATLAKISAGIEPTKDEILKLRKWCFPELSESDSGHVNQGADRPFREACAATEGAKKIQSLIEKHNLSTNLTPSLDDVYHIDFGHFPPKEEKIQQSGILYINPKTGDAELVIGHIALMDGLMVDGDSDLHTDSSKKAEYEALTYRFFEPSLKAFEEMVMQCKYLKTVTVFGHEMGRKMIDGTAFSTSRLRRILDKCGRTDVKITNEPGRPVAHPLAVSASWCTEECRDVTLKNYSMVVASLLGVEEQPIPDHLMNVLCGFRNSLPSQSLLLHPRHVERAEAIDADLDEGKSFKDVFEKYIATYSSGRSLTSSEQHERLDALADTGLLSEDIMASLREYLQIRSRFTTIEERAAAINEAVGQNVSIETIFKENIATKGLSRSQQVERINALEKRGLLPSDTIESLRGAIPETTTKSRVKPFSVSLTRSVKSFPVASTSSVKSFPVASTSSAKLTMVRNTPETGQVNKSALTDLTSRANMSTIPAKKRKATKSPEEVPAENVESTERLCYRDQDAPRHIGVMEDAIRREMLGGALECYQAGITSNQPS